MSGATSIIFPFRGIRYRTTGGRDLSSRLAPPYDVIDERRRTELEARDARNFVRIELPQPPAVETEQDNRYLRAAGTLRAWLEEGAMGREERPCLYVLEQEFQASGRSWRRRGVFAALRLPEEGERYVLSHEATFAGPKADRLRLMQACEAMTSPILMMSEDRGSALLSGLSAISGEPEAVATDHEGVAHRLWVVRDEAAIASLCGAVGQGPLYIADGHHRFETALNCRDRMRQLTPGAPAGAGFNHALVLVTSAQDEALQARPTHRLLRGLGAAGRARLQEQMQREFVVQEMSPEAALAALAEATGEYVYAACGPEERGYLLTARRERLHPHPTPVEALEVSVLHARLIDPAREAAGEAAQLDFLHDARAAVAAVARGEYDFACFLRPVSVAEVLRIAREGKRMPHKSTFFYPKAPAGLVVSSLGADEV